MATWDKERDVEALLESVTRYRQLVEITPDWVWRIDLQGVHTYSNPAIYPLLGYQVSEIVGTNAFPLIHPDDEQPAREMLKQCIAQKVGWHNVAIRWLHKDGAVRSFESTASPMVNADGQITGFSGIDRDITERRQAEEALLKKAEELHAAYEELTASQEELRQNVNDLTRSEQALRESEVRFRSLFQNMDSLFSLYEVVLDEGGKPRDYRFIEINPPYEKFIGIPSSELIGRTLLEVFPLTESYWMDKFNEVYNTGIPSHFENDSQELDTYIELSIYMPQAGQIALISSDITERKRAEEALHLFKDLVEHSSDAIGMSTPDGRHYYQNEAFNRLFGTIGDNPPVSVYVDKAIGKHVFDTIIGGGNWQGEIKMAHR
ncbi:MAG: PAS domain S-box protein [Methanomicrobiales archaeon]